MKVLWAPWRMDYILSDDKNPECIFCTDENRDTDDERLILYRGNLTMVMMNRFPYINGHLLVAPVRHVSGPDKLSNDESLNLMKTLSRSIEIIKKNMTPEGFNVGLNLGKAAGAGVEEHMHFHIVPRWNGDTNYMTIFEEVRVIPEHIVSTYKKLKPAFCEVEG